MLIRVVSQAAVASVMTWDLAFAAVRRAFINSWDGSALNFPVLAGSACDKSTAINVKLGCDGAAVALKVGTFWPGNEERGFANHNATTLLLDTTTGLPYALVAASLLNRFRTAAADAVATAALSRADARVLAVLGAGRQAEYEVRAIAAIRSLSEIRIGARSQDAAVSLAGRLDDLGIPIRCHSIESAVTGADIIVCITSATDAVFQEEWVSEGAHVSAMGADRRGKQEVPALLFERALTFADDPSQSSVIGECQHPVAIGTIGLAAIIPIGAVLAGAAAGRTSHRDITIFDSSGLAVQDLAVAIDVLEVAERLGLCETVEI